MTTDTTDADYDNLPESDRMIVDQLVGCLERSYSAAQKRPPHLRDTSLNLEDATRQARQEYVRALKNPESRSAQHLRTLTSELASGGPALRT